MTIGTPWSCFSEDSLTSDRFGLVQEKLLSICHVVAILLPTGDVVLNDAAPAPQELKV